MAINATELRANQKSHAWVWMARRSSLIQGICLKHRAAASPKRVSERLLAGFITLIN